ncbi:hypothetical protein THAOC_22576 [Thalassiosira oceanica]|uniref:Uncharacterized protein n=1 Tax=Thalassiosira oceanica TaxID=159749 RepID=K0RU54_THAOC|nr:hypothetical protein THAOC_22576 [Thalassiosira oceanica]|eukprot:EJK57383.1 hypothetical protein THAOC_22576 [Thalassiosira oceanica]
MFSRRFFLRVSRRTSCREDTLSVVCLVGVQASPNIIVEDEGGMLYEYNTRDDTRLPFFIFFLINGAEMRQPSPITVRITSYFTGL